MSGVLLLAALSLSAGIAEDLYGHRLLFDADGMPVIPIGMMQGASRVMVESAQGLTVTIGDTEIEIAPAVPLLIERIAGRPARVQEVLVIDTLEADDRARKRDVLAERKAAGVRASLIDVGGVYGVKGTVVDNRASLIFAPPSQRALLEKLGARPVLLERLNALPSGTLRVCPESAAADTAQSCVGAVTGATARVRPKGSGALTVRDVEHSVGYAGHGFADRELRGELVVLFDKNGQLAVVNLVAEDALVAGVLPSEMFATAPMEALKAQAVTARGELFSKIGRRHFADPYLVCSEQHCQVYKGLSAEHPRASKAAEDTKGELAFVDGRVIPSVYSACCGGHTEAADAVWDQPPHSALAGRVDAPHADPASRTWLMPGMVGSALLPELVHAPLDLRRDEAVRAFLDMPRAGAFCGRSSFNQKGEAWRWERRFATAELDAAFADLGVGAVQSINVEERGPGGRLRALVVSGTKKTARILRELPVRKRLGNLRSGLFVIEEERDAEGALLGVTLRGAGFGHGSGMCQQGAIGMAEAGYSYQAILKHYYAGCVVKRVF